MKSRSRNFARFMRGVVRSPDLASHPLVLEFLKIDHYSIDKKVGMKEFSKKLITRLEELQKE